MNPLRRLRYLFRRRQTEAEMAEEMRFHLEQRAADFAADGVPETEARGWRWLKSFAQDLRFSFRLLAKSPGFTVATISVHGLVSV